MKKSQREELILAGKKMIEKHMTAVITPSRSLSFVKDMIIRMESGKSLSPAQLAWFNSAILEEPKVHNAELVNKLRSYWDVVGLPSHARDVLMDFTVKLSKGYALSEKQQAYLDSIVKDVEDILANGFWEPTPEEKEKIVLGYKLSEGYHPTYMDTHPGLKNAIQSVRDWHNGFAKSISKKEAEIVSQIKKHEQEEIRLFEQTHKCGDLTRFKLGKKGEWPIFVYMNNGIQQHVRAREIDSSAVLLLINNKPEISRGLPFVEIFIGGLIQKVSIYNVV